MSCHDIHGKIDRKMLSINALTMGLEIAEDCYLDLVSISRSRFIIVCSHSFFPVRIV